MGCCAYDALNEAELTLEDLQSMSTDLRALVVGVVLIWRLVVRGTPYSPS